MNKIGDEDYVDSAREDSVNKLIQSNGPPRGFQLPGPAPGSGRSFFCLRRPEVNLNYYARMVPGYQYHCWPADHGTPGFVLGAVPQYFPTVVYGPGTAPPPIPIHAIQQYPRQMDGARDIDNKWAAGVEYAGNTPNTMTPGMERMPRITSLDSQHNGPEFGNQMVVKTMPQNSIRSSRSIPIVQQTLPVAMDKRSEFMKNQAGGRDRCSETSPTVLSALEGKLCNPKNRLPQKMRENHTSANFANIASRMRGMPRNYGSTPQGVQFPKPPSMGEMRLEKPSPQRFAGPPQFLAPLLCQQRTPTQLDCGMLSDAMEKMNMWSSNQPSSSIGPRDGQSRTDREFPKILRVSSNSSCSNTSLGVLAEKKAPADSCCESPCNDDQVGQSDPVRNTHRSQNNKMKGTEVVEISETPTASLPSYQEDKSSQELKKRAQILYELGNRTVPSPDEPNVLVESGDKDPSLLRALPKTNTDTTLEQNCNILKKDHRVAGFVCKFCRRCFPRLNLISDHFVSDHFRDVSTLEAAFGLRYQPVICEMCSCPFALCSYCGEAYYSEKGVKKHIKIHKLRKTFKCKYCDKTFERKSHNLHLLTHKGIKPYCGSCSVPSPQSSPSKDNGRFSVVAANKHDSPITRNDNEPCRKSASESAIVATVGTPTPCLAAKNSGTKLGAKRLIVLVERLETCNAASIQDLIDGSYKRPTKHKYPHYEVSSAKSMKSSTSEITNKIARYSKDSIALGCEDQTPPSDKTLTSDCFFKCKYCDKTFERKSHNLHLLTHRGIEPCCGSCSVPSPQSSPSKDNGRFSGVAANKHDTPITRNENEPCRKSVTESAIGATVGTPTPCLAAENSAPKLGAKRLIVLVERLETCNAASIQDLIDGSYKRPTKHKYPHYEVNSAKSKKSSTSEISKKIASDSKDSIALGCEDQTPPIGKTRMSDCSSNIADKQVDDNVGQVAEESEDSAAEAATPPKNETSNHANDLISDLEGEEISNSASVLEALNCEICEKTFKFLVELSDHMSTHFDGSVTSDSASPAEPSSTLFQRFSCEVCGIDYDDIEIMSEHMKEHELAANLSDLTQNCQDDIDKPGLVQRYSCELCSIDFDDVEILTQHMEDHIANEAEETLKEPLSEICGIDFDDPKILSEHMEEHTEESSDDECDSAAANYSQPEVKTQEIIPEIFGTDGISYTRQILSNDTAALVDVREERTQSCPICSQLFFDANEYEKHYSYFPFTLHVLCHNCGFNFLDFTSFQSHTKICKSMCAKSMYQPTISSHVIIPHLRRLWILCEKCGTHFSPDRELIRHLDSTPCGVLVKSSDPQRNYELVASNDKGDVFLFRMESVTKEQTFAQKLEVYRAKSSASDEESRCQQADASNTRPQFLQAARCRYFKFPLRNGPQNKVNEDGEKSTKRKNETRQTTYPKRPRIIWTTKMSRLNQRDIRAKAKSRLNLRDRFKAGRQLKRLVTDKTRRPQPPHNKLINRKRQRTGTVRRKFASMSNNISVIILGVSTEKIQNPENMEQLQEDPAKGESQEQTWPPKGLAKEKSLEQTWPPNIVVILDMPSEKEVNLSSPKDSIEHFNAITANSEVESQAGFYCRRCDKSFSTLNVFMAHDECKSDAEKRFALLKRDHQLEMICRICGLKFLVCHFCGKHLSSLKDFKMHVKLHRHGKAFDCTVCRKKLLSHLTPHFAKHHKQTASICKFCDVFNPMKMSKWLHNVPNDNANFENYPCLCRECSKFVAPQSAYDSHQKCCLSKRKSEGTKYFCDICNTDFLDPQALCNHIQDHEQKKKNICEICLRRFLRSATLAIHKAKEHGIPIEEEKPNMCETCGITFVSKDSLRIHLSEPHALLHCKKCHGGFKTLTTLIYHNTHRCKKKPYKCEKCHKRFTTELELYLHSIKYKELMKELQCKKCRKCFIFQKTLSHHKKMCGIPLACQKCAKVFLSKELMNAHKRKCDHITLPENKFSCAECSLKFYTWNAYEIHTTSFHERQVPDSCKMIQCDSCPEKFAFEASYGMHLRRHKSEGTFVKGPGKCEDCSHQYNSIMDKMKHICPWECPDCGEKVLARKRHKQNAIDRHKAKHISSECGTEMTNGESLEHERDGVADGNQGAVVSPVPKSLGSDKEKVNADGCTNTENDSVEAVTDVTEHHISLTTEEK